VIPAETVIIAGPTGAGKTTLSLALAERLCGEIVGADAFQVYSGLPILTAQPTPFQQSVVRHHLIGSVDPLECYDAGRYLREAAPILTSIVARGRTPILVGGTGLYFKALLEGLDDLPPNDPELRRELASLSLPALIQRLRAADPKAPDAIDLANRRRVERALEIILLTGKPLAESRTNGGVKTPEPGLRALLITRDREELSARIQANVLSQFEQGVEVEVAAMPEERIGPTASMTLGLREIRAVLRGEVTRIHAIEAITTATRRYAKRQMTWFRNQHSFPTLNLSSFPDHDQAVEEALRLFK
jgi:tRNA dimethylallyltransferase